MNYKSYLRGILLASGILSLFISLMQLLNDNVKYSILSLCYSSIFIMAYIQNLVISKNKKAGLLESNPRLIYSSLMLGLFLGITVAYIVLEMIL